MPHHFLVGVNQSRRLFVAVLLASVFGIGVYHTTLSSFWQQEEAAIAPRLHTAPHQVPPSLPITSALSLLSRTTNNSNATEATVLLVYDSVNAKLLAEGVRTFLQAHRVPFVYHSHGYTSTARLRWVASGNGTARGLYGLLVVADSISFFSRWTAQERRTYTDYCKRFGVSAIFLTNTNGRLKKRIHRGNDTLGFRISSPDSVSVTASVEFNHTKPGVVLSHVPRGVAWFAFAPPPSGTQVWAWAVRSKMVRPVVLVTREEEGMVSAYFGMPFDLWLTKLLFLDALSLLPDPLVPVLRYGRERLVMVDVDDIFVGNQDMRLHKDDVEAMVGVQERLGSYVPGFTFNLGFSGGLFSRGDPLEVEGSQEIVRVAEKFWWFEHMYKHQKPHLGTEEQLIENITQNIAFARQYGIPAFANGYSIAPHHSGVYPVHPPLYSAWKKTYNVSVTSTLEYPHRSPAHMRRGFVHQEIMVLPRQTCKLFSYHYSLESYQGGLKSLIASAEGGEVFETLLHNPVTIFMTHMPNFGHDRLALVLFEALFRFVHTWTNLQLIADRPLNMATRYFTIFPEDIVPVWTSPCNDGNHMSIFSHAPNCTNLPSVLVVGPQKTGSTALRLYLKQHPHMCSNRLTERYEETQFFSNEIAYSYGVNWYMDQFPYPNVSGSPCGVVFEKTANYFNHELGPLRAHTLLPRAKIIVILSDPIKRAYSWYQHQVAHNFSTALNYSFSEVLYAPYYHNASEALLNLTLRCLLPGEYHIHIERWLLYYPPEQLMFVDGEELLSDPASVMDQVQHFLNLHSILDYAKILRFDVEKGFHCIVKEQDNLQCLGPSKGRHYPPMSQEEMDYLIRYFKEPNRKLVALLNRLSRPVPDWLYDDDRLL
ncbi:hypothetical protein EMCRGX_G008243 [Ephydatia muelleri]